MSDNVLPFRMQNSSEEWETDTLPKQVLMGRHDFQLYTQVSHFHPETGMYCVLCHAKMNSERGQAPCTGRAE